MITGRRSFLRVVGMGAAGALAGPAAAWADRIRILGGGGNPEQAFAFGQVSGDFQRFVDRVRVGQARGYRTMLVFWLFGEAPPAALEVATLDEARSRGDLLITERDQASVPQLLVENRGKVHVLLLAGEILLGGKQNRVLSEDILLPPLSGPRNIAVYCVEQGRWAERTKEFEAKGTFAAPSLRARLMEKADQARVWAEVDRASKSAGAASPTRSYQEVYEQPQVKDHLKEVERGIDHRAAPGALGAAVFLGETFAGLDLFQDPGLFAREWPKLLRAHALETYRRPPQAGWDERRARARLEGLLRASATAEGSLRGNAGVGQLFEFRVDGLKGSAQILDGRLIHAAVL